MKSKWALVISGGRPLLGLSAVDCPARNFLKSLLTVFLSMLMLSREQNSSRSRSRCEQNASRSLIAIAICSRNARDQCTYDSEPNCIIMDTDNLMDEISA